MKTPAIPTFYLVGGFVAVVGVVLLIRNAGAVAQAASQAVVGAVVGVGTGTVKGVGMAVGIPLTDSQKCAACKKIKDTFGASKFCTAAQFLRYLATGK
ncbi:MAG: hypothetical protein ABL856_12525 [Gallionella sp.]